MASSVIPFSTELQAVINDKTAIDRKLLTVIGIPGKRITVILEERLTTGCLEITIGRKSILAQVWQA
jgi:hypothetical protein